MWFIIYHLNFTFVSAQAKFVIYNTLIILHLT